MPWIFEANGIPTGYAAIAPPTNEQGERESGWVEVMEGDPRIDAALNPSSPVALDWERLTDTLRGSAVWAKAFGSAMQSIAANAAMTLLLNSLTSTHSLQDLRFAFTTLRQVMLTTPGLADFSETELSFLRSTLTERGFDAAIVDLP